MYKGRQAYPDEGQEGEKNPENPNNYCYFEWNFIV